MEIIINKRKFERLRTSDLRILFSRNWNEIATQVDVINISLGGLCFLTKSALRIDEKIILTFPFNNKFIILKSTVAWIEGREVGVQFAEDDQSLIDFMEIFNKEYPKVDKNLTANQNKLVAPLNFAKKNHSDVDSLGIEIEKLADYD